jgi:hypothetical protein
MLGQTLVLLALVATFAATAVAGIAGVARARTVETARALVAPAIESALAAYVHELGATIAAQAPQPAGDGAAPPPAVSALNGGTAFPTRHYAEAAAGSGFTVAVDVTPDAPSLPVCASGVPGTDTGPDLEVNGQCSAFVQESRLALDVVAQVGVADDDGNVSPLADDRTTVTLRLFAQPPYASIAGIEDAVASSTPHEGDVDGYGYGIGSFAAPLPQGDTTIHVVYACTPALGDCSASRPPPADDPTSLPWTNGN